MLAQIIFEKRFERDKGNDCLISVDDTDFLIPRRGKAFYSHKFNKSALRYEVALCILTGDIVWINGPYEPGLWNDLTIFQNSLQSNLEEQERVEADDGYIGAHPEFAKCPRGFADPAETLAMQARVRHRQETINLRFKFFGAMKQTWRHEIGRHGIAFRAIAIILQLTINTGERLFAVNYRDPPYGEVQADGVANDAEQFAPAEWEDQANEDATNMVDS